MSRIALSTALLLVSVLSAADASAQRRRAVRSPAPQCSYSLVPGWGSSISAAGVQDATLTVIASPSTCTSWNAYSLTDWVTVERSGSLVRVDVAPNPTTTPRTATLLVAGVRHEVVQEGSQVVSPPIEGTLLRNGGFDTDLSFWGWQDRFPNGNGSAAWSGLDGTNKPNSGSIRIRNTRPTNEGPAYQQLQCAAVEGGAGYDFGFRFFATATTGSAVIAVVEYEDEGCNTATVAKVTRTKIIQVPGTWQSETFDMRMRATTRSALVVIGAFASPGTSYEVFLDDVFLKKR